MEKVSKFLELTRPNQITRPGLVARCNYSCIHAIRGLSGATSSCDIDGEEINWDKNPCKFGLSQVEANKLPSGSYEV